MAEIVNLNRARKAKARVTAKTEAAANRAAFGRTKAEKAADAEAATRREALLDGIRREDLSSPPRHPGERRDP